MKSCDLFGHFLVNDYHFRFSLARLAGKSHITNTSTNPWTPTTHGKMKLSKNPKYGWNNGNMGNPTVGRVQFPSQIRCNFSQFEAHEFNKRGTGPPDMGHVMLERVGSWPGKKQLAKVKDSIGSNKNWQNNTYKWVCKQNYRDFQWWCCCHRGGGGGGGVVLPLLRCEALV